jgi:hypothetical protein
MTSPSRERYQPIQLIRSKPAKEIQISKQPAFIPFSRHTAAPLYIHTPEQS